MSNRTETKDGRPVYKNGFTTICIISIFVLLAAIALCLSLGAGAFGTHATALAEELKLEQTAESDASADSSESPDDGDDSSSSSQDDGSDEGDDSEEPSEADTPFEPIEEPSSTSPEKEESEDDEGYGGLVVIVVDYDYEQHDRDESNYEAVQGDASFKGITFDIYNEKGKRVRQIVAEEDGYAALAEEDFLPLGVYFVKLDGDSARACGYEENSEWANDGVRVVIDEDDTYTDAGTCPCKVIRGEVQLNLVDGELFDTLGINDRAQGKAKLDGAVFELYNGSAHSVVVDGEQYEPYQGGDSGQPIMELVTDESGLASSNSDAKGEGLPWGTYIMKQKKASTGYKGPNDEGLDENGEYIDLDNRLTGAAMVRGDGVFETEDVIRAETKHGGVKITMVDGETADGKAQGDASLKGTVFEVLSANGENSTVMYNGEAYANGDVILKVTTNAKGLAITEAEELPFGTYKVRMCKDKGTRSYAYDEAWSAKLKVKKNGKRASLGKNKAFAAKTVRGGVTLKRLEKVSKKPVPGGAFEVVNASKKAVVVGGKSYEPGKAVLKLKVSDEGIAKSGKNELPYGTYTLREVEAGDGHELSRTWNKQFKIRKAEEVIDAGTIFDEASPEAPVEEDKGDSSIPILPFIIILLVAAAGAAAVMMLMRKRDAAAENGEAPTGPEGQLEIASQRANDDFAFEGSIEPETIAMDTVAMDTAAMDTVAMGAVAMDTVAMDTEALNTELLQSVDELPQEQTVEDRWADTKLIADDIFGVSAEDATQAFDATVAADVTQALGGADAADATLDLEAANAADLTRAFDVPAPDAMDTAHALDAIRAVDLEDATIAMDVANEADLHDTIPAEYLEDVTRVLDAIKALNVEKEAEVIGTAAGMGADDIIRTDYLLDDTQILNAVAIPGIADAIEDAPIAGEESAIDANTTQNLEDALPAIDAPEDAGVDEETTAKLYPVAEAFPDNDPDETRSFDALDETIEFGAVKPLMPYDLSTGKQRNGKQRNEPRNGFFKRKR